MKRILGISFRMSLAGLCFFHAAWAAAEFPSFKTHDINPEAGTGLAITAADVNGDGRLDIVGVSDKNIYWHENPSWAPHRISDTIKNSNVCIAARDLDGDGLPEFALGADWQFNNTASGGSLHLLRRRASLDEAWEVIDLLTEPTLHRIRWMDIDGKPALIVAPLKGRNTTGPLFAEAGVRLMALTPPADLRTPWPMTVIDDSLHVLHNIAIGQFDGRPGDDILAASFEGITMISYERARWTSKTVAKGNPEPLPQSGAGEIKLGRLNGATIFATVEPWHGRNAVVYTHGASGEFVRHVVNSEMDEGHAVAWADFDGDGEDEVLFGWRGSKGPTGKAGLVVYALEDSAAGTELKSSAHNIDDGGMATEDALTADFNGDGRPDIAAFGRATHNIRYYENLGSAR